MVEVTNELIYQVLQRVQADLSEVKLDIRELRHRAGSLVRLMAGLSSRIDRRDDMMERVLRRLDLIDDEQPASS